MNLRALPSVLVVCVVPVLAAQGIPAPESRDKVIDALAKICSVGSVQVPDTVAKDPFFPPPEDLVEQQSPNGDGNAVRRSDEELVAALAAQVHPTGSLVLGGEPYLLFTERRQKNGDKLVVLLDRIEYVVEIVSISNNRFRIRYNDKEAERTIK